MDPDGLRELEAAGVIDSKFGTVTLLGWSAAPRRAPASASSSASTSPTADFRLVLPGRHAPARRAAIACMLNRLTLLTAGNDPKLAELFARAELRRSDCAPSRPAFGGLADRDRQPARCAVTL